MSEQANVAEAKGPSLLLPAASMWKREVITFLRARSRVTGAVAFPLMMWLLLGTGFSASFRPANAVENIDYLEYFFPGAIVLVVVFTAIFSPATLIEDRKAGFLQSVMVAPVSRLSIVLGKIFGSTTLALGQGALFLIIAPFIGISLNPMIILSICAALIAIGFWVTSLGFIIAWKIDSTPGFHAIGNMLFVPMWFLSGAMFPAEGGATWMRVAMLANPLTYGMALMRYAFYGVGAQETVGLPSLELSMAITIGFCVITLWGALLIINKKTVAV